MNNDLRNYARQTNIRLFFGFLLLLFIVGDGLILIFYGLNAAFVGLICMLSGLAPLVLIWLALICMEWITQRVNKG